MLFADEVRVTSLREYFTAAAVPAAGVLSSGLSRFRNAFRSRDFSSFLSISKFVWVADSYMPSATVTTKVT